MGLIETKNLIIGEWQFADGRKIKFVNQDRYILTIETGESMDSPYFLTANDNLIKLSLPFLMSPVCIIESIDNNELIYKEYAIDNTFARVTLRKIDQ